MDVLNSALNSLKGKVHGLHFGCSLQQILMETTNTYGESWPLTGEIDIMESVNLGARCDDCTGDDGENRTSNALHFGSLFPNNQHVGDRTTLIDETNPAEDYHVWAVEWGEGIMKWFLDGQHYSTITFYIIINLAIGGNYPEPLNEGGIADETLPNQLLVDWVRVYQCTEDLDTGLSCMQ